MIVKYFLLVGVEPLKSLYCYQSVFSIANTVILVAIDT